MRIIKYELKTSKLVNCRDMIYGVSRNSGFSLLEMLITVAIIGIIAVSAVPVAEITYIKTQEDLLQNNLEIIRDAIKRWKRDCRIAVERRLSMEGISMMKVNDSKLYPRKLEYLISPPLGGVTVYSDGLVNIIFYPKPYLNAIPIDPFVGIPEWTIHYASATVNAPKVGTYSHGMTHNPDNIHYGIFDISCIADPVKRRGFVNAIDQSKYTDW